MAAADADVFLGEVPQLPGGGGGGPLFTVKNTFISGHADDVDQQPGLVPRAITAPVAKSGSFDEYDVGAAPPPAPAPAEEMGEESPPPMLERVRTQNFFEADIEEPLEHWRGFAEGFGEQQPQPQQPAFVGDAAPAPVPPVWVQYVGVQPVMQGVYMPPAHGPPAAPAPALGESATPMPPLGMAGAPEDLAPSLQRSFSRGSGCTRVQWEVQGRKFEGTDKSIVSPEFGLSFGDKYLDVPFRLSLFPSKCREAKGGANFKKADGRGLIQLKCEARQGDVQGMGNIHFRFSIGSGAQRRDPRFAMRGPVAHDYGSNAVCGLPAGSEEWDFKAAVDQATSSLVVSLEIMPAAAAFALSRSHGCDHMTVCRPNE